MKVQSIVTVYSLVLCTESDDVRLVGGTSRCIGILEMQHQREWRPVDGWSDWNQKSSSVVCRQLDCGSAVSTDRSSGVTRELVWWISLSCFGSETSLKECGTKVSVNSTARLEVICSGKTMTYLHSPIVCPYFPPSIYASISVHLPNKLLSLYISGYSKKP